MKEMWIARNEDIKLDGITLEKGSLYVSVNKPHMEMTHYANGGVQQEIMVIYHPVYFQK